MFQSIHFFDWKISYQPTKLDKLSPKSTFQKRSANPTLFKQITNTLITLILSKLISLSINFSHHRALKVEHEIGWYFLLNSLLFEPFLPQYSTWMWNIKYRHQSAKPVTLCSVLSRHSSTECMDRRRQKSGAPQHWRYEPDAELCAASAASQYFDLIFSVLPGCRGGLSSFLFLRRNRVNSLRE